eukprot:PITA_30200
MQVGNGIMNCETDILGQITYPWTHALISDESYEALIKSKTGTCSSGLDLVFPDIGNIDPYGIFAPLCPSNSSGQAKEEAEIRGYDPCLDYYVQSYLNRPDVQKAIHAKETTWATCNGDTDSSVPVTSTRFSINKLKLPIETPWYPWLDADEVGGYTVIYKGLTFATVRGAGHEVPKFQPSRTLTLLKSFLAGKPLPS